jgi:hypothetical protein
MSADAKVDIRIAYSKDISELALSGIVSINATDEHLFSNIPDVDDTPVEIEMGQVAADPFLLVVYNPSAVTDQSLVVSSDALAADVIALVPPGKTIATWLPFGAYYASLPAVGSQEMDYAVFGEDDGST